MSSWCLWSWTFSLPSQEPSVTSLQMLHWSFPGSSAGKESACNVGDPGLISGSGRSTGERIGYSLQYSWASLVAHLVKNLPAIQETWVQSLGQEDPLENEMPAHSNILPWRIPWMRSQVGYSPWGHKELDITKRLTLILKKKKNPTWPQFSHVENGYNIASIYFISLL